MHNHAVSALFAAFILIGHLYFHEPISAFELLDFAYDIAMLAAARRTKKPDLLSGRALQRQH
jgi:hypothetical protein